MTDVGETEIATVQVALNTADMIGSLRLYSGLLGFSNAGGNAAWGDILQIQDVGPDAESLIWWLVGGAPFFQLELFHHTRPKQRPLPADWRPCDHGWVRIGIAVADLDRIAAGLDGMSIPILGRNGSAPRRRFAFRDPFAGVIVELLEGAAEHCPALVYATSSVGDLAGARAFYRDIIRAEIQPLDFLHGAEDEALWGLEGAQRDGFLARLPGGILEILCYSDPVGKPRPADHRTSDQGIMNIGIGSRDYRIVRDMIRRVEASGTRMSFVVDTGDICATYVTQSGYELELLSVPHALDGVLGFEKTHPLMAAFGKD